MTPTACAVLAVAAVILPAPAAAGRFAALWPPGRPRSGRRPVAAAPVLAGGIAGLLIAGPGGAVAGALVVHTVRRRRLRHRTAVHAAALSGQLADAVSRITEELRAGSHPAAALGAVRADGPLAQRVLAPAAATARLGDGVPAALRRHTDEAPTAAADMERIAAAWSLAERHGIPLVELLGRAHEEIRWRVRFGATVRAQLAGPRATATVLTALPLLGLGLGQLVGADPVGVLRGGVTGQLLLVVGVGLVAAGAAWSERILSGAVPR